jgi:hypothetical protein
MEHLQASDRFYKRVLYLVFIDQKLYFDCCGFSNDENRLGELTSLIEGYHSLGIHVHSRRRNPELCGMGDQFFNRS